MTTFQVPGAQIALEYSDEQGHPVVQLHGLTSSRARDRQLDLDLGRGLHGTRLLRYDARGHGQSTGRTVAEDYRWENLAHDLLLLLDEWFPGEQVHGVGPSMGCGTLLHAACLEPDRFSGLTLMLPATAWETRVAKSVNYLAAADLIEQQGVGAFLKSDKDLPTPPATAGTPDTLPDVSAELLPWAFRGAALSDLPAPELLRKLDIPTTILAWIDDPAHPISTAQALVEYLPHATLQVASTRTEVKRWPLTLAKDVARD
ncbi:alpha/beta fold hydrolase [Corynebacterium alimapuense]|uniref:Alpha/beta hydrolase n=1 Tax=Corynebacterium alimapuense TaxID=1576874 RepID=A0A3M8K5M9_9CORY|nr:alpha/beta hydrolase [Corynebacterium alimapuense]RNE48501.1 alpha/beta hydrolase [Corynebacterium alimapuense]